MPHMWLSMSSVAGVVAPAEDLLWQSHGACLDRGVPDVSAGSVEGSHPPLGDLPMALS
jgi:hypothetical protein